MFSRFVLLVDFTDPSPLFQQIGKRSRWEPVDRALLLLVQRTEAKRTKMKVIVTRRVRDPCCVARHMVEDAFPLMMSVEAFELEVDDSFLHTRYPVL